MRKPHISIVMPSFNADQYIKESVSSILDQSFYDFELIIIDDCSTDNTFSIISKIAKYDHRVIVERLSKNSGSAKYPRDYAVKKAKSELICWIDADDVIEQDYLKRLFSKMRNMNADIVCSRMSAFKDEVSNIVYRLPKKEYNENCLSGNEAVMKTIGLNWSLNANGWLIKKDIWLSTSTFLNSEISHMNVDDFSSREMLIMSKNVVLCNEPYHYRLHNTSITKKISSKLFEVLLTDVMVIDLFRKTFGEKSNQIKKAKNQLIVHLFNSAIKFTNSKNYLTDYEKTKCLQHLRNGYIECSKLNILYSTLAFKHKIIILLPFRIFLWTLRLINS